MLFGRPLVYITKGLGLGLERILKSWSCGLGLEIKVLVLVLKKSLDYITGIETRKLNLNISILSSAFCSRYSYTGNALLRLIYAEFRIIRGSSRRVQLNVLTAPPRPLESLFRAT